ncbi:hypothetical protein CSB95_1159 [Pseudomonas aeruginosa]|nr:hypothetical protein CSC29_4737 [Pseudomonas aeruginosa]PRW07089.1 hypothetical protein CSB95_1159 [Pseudomonas aeruginosa]
MFNECGAWIKGGIITGKRAPLTPAMLRSRSASPAAQCCMDCNALLRRRYLHSAL